MAGRGRFVIAVGIVPDRHGETLQSRMWIIILERRNLNDED